jgi:2-dehydro-3-deoxyphosphogluconate aldolase / (4S)-4-hydroxy-2-oxoglutarate aldolase
MIENYFDGAYNTKIDLLLYVNLNPLRERTVMHPIVAEIQKEKVVSIIRSESIHDLEEVVAALYEGGIRVVEITLNTPGALKGIEMIRMKYPEMVVGAGTVLDGETARIAILAGASFLLTPVLNEGSILMANSYHVPIIPGVMTPTEIMKAYELGAQIVKVFPMNTLGIQYLKDLRGPLPQVHVMPVGGVNLDNIKEYLDAGSFAVGIGSSLVSNQLIMERNFKEIHSRAKRFVERANGIVN